MNITSINYQQYNAINTKQNNVNMKGNLYSIAKSKMISEQNFDKLIDAMPKRKNGTIDARFFDKKDKKIFNEMKGTYKQCQERFTASIDDFKRYFRNLITNEKQEVYNGRTAKVTRNLFGNICSIKTEALTEIEAAKSLRLKRCGTVITNRNGSQEFVYENYKKIDGVPLYKAEYKTVEDGIKITNEDFFVWNDKTNAMDHI